MSVWSSVVFGPVLDPKRPRPTKTKQTLVRKGR